MFIINIIIISINIIIIIISESSIFLEDLFCRLYSMVNFYDIEIVC